MIRLSVICRLLFLLSLVLPVAAGAVSNDHNNDSKSDILWRNSVTGQNWIYLMDGPTIMTSAEINIVSNFDWSIAATADFDGDGNVDILWRNYATGENWMYLMDGPTIVSSVRVNGVSNLNWRIVGSGDFDADGKSDILWRDKTTGQNWMYLMDGAAILSSAAVNIVSNQNWHVVAIGDFDGDAKADIFWRDFVTGENWLYLMNGPNINNSVRVNGVSNLNWRVVGNGDYDGNGKVDILWRDFLSGQNWMYLMDGPSISTSAPVNVVSNQDWQIVGSGDYDGDGKSDILWREMTTGVNWLYLMNGSNILVSARVNGVSNLNWEINTDVPAPLTESGLFVRPSNTTCLAPNRPISNAAIDTELAFPSLPTSSSQAVALLRAPGDNSQWYVVHKWGGIYRFANTAGVSSRSTFINIAGPGGPVDVDSSAYESGLLGMAFHPDYATNRQVFLSYTVTGPNGTYPFTSRISRFTSNDDGLTLDPATEDVLLTLDQPYGNHNGGNIVFGPDGYLYIGFGDGGSGGDPGDRAQNTTNLFGSILRIDVDGGAPYGIPSDNPFSPNPLCNDGDGTLACPEIFAWGLRNPWRWSFDSATGQLWLGDVGQGQYEEADIIELGGNYGWRCREGAHDFNTSGLCPSNLIDPILEYDHAEGQSITGGYVYRGAAIPELFGRYIFADFVNGKIFASTTDTSGNFGYEVLIDTNLNISTFGEDESNEILFVDYAGNTIHRMIQMGGTSTNTVPDQLSATGCVDPNEPSTPVSGAIPYDTIASFWSDGAEKQRWYAIPDGTTVDIDADGDWLFPIGTVLMKNFRLNNELYESRLLMRHTDGEWGGYTYEWNDSGTDATRVIGGKTKDIAGQSVAFPSESQCMSCHTSAAAFSLGPEHPQLNTDVFYPSTAITANQLTTADEIGILTDPLLDTPENLPTLSDPADTEASLEDRARSYLHSNCAYCHRPSGPTPSNMDLRFETEFSATNTCNVTPTSGDLGIFDARIIAPGDAARSVLVNRMGRRDVYGMPPLASNIVDTEGTNLLASWIDNLVLCSLQVPPVINDPGDQSGRVNTGVLLNVTATDANGDTLTFFATGLPAGLGIAPDGTISGIPTTTGVWSVTVTVDDGIGGFDSATFNWTIEDALTCMDCIAYWPFDEGSGAIAGDASSQTHQGTIVGAAWTMGLSGWALSFDGDSDFVQVPHAVDISFTAADSYSVSAWVNVPSLPGSWTGVVTKSRDVSPWYGIWISSANQWIYGGSTNVTGTPLTTGWHHIAIVQDVAAGQRRLYVDGVLDASGTPVNSNGTGDLFVGSAGTAEYFSGLIDEVRIYGRNLSALEITVLAGGTVPVEPPIADAGADQTVVDMDGNGSEPVTLDGSGSSDADGSITNYRWTEGVTVLAEGASASAAVSLAVGVHTVTLEVTDDDALTATDTALITVDPQPANTAPLVNAGPDLTVAVGEQLQISGATATDDGLPIPPGAHTVLWTEEGSSVASWPLVDQTNVVTHVVFSAAGSYVLRLTADDSALSAFDELTVTVNGDVDTPEMTPPGGTYPDPQLVSLSTVTSTTSIFYTLDGADPTEISTPYTGSPISISVDTTLKARAYKVDFNPSAVATANYLIYQVPVNGLIAYWPLDEGSGSTTDDISSQNHQGTVNGASWTTGLSGGALSFDGVGDFVRVPHAADISFTAADSYTVSAWVHVSNLPGAWSGVITKSRDVSPWYGLWISSSNQWIYGGPTNINGSAVSTGWHHVALVQDVAGGQRRLYVDGILDVIGTPTNSDGSGDLLIGSAAGGEDFAGLIDEVRIYDRNLSDSEIFNLANQFAP